MSNSIFCIVFILTISSSGFSQSWFDKNNYGEKLEGYIIGIAGDSVHGYIQYDYPVAMQKRIQFYKSLSENQPVVYRPEDIRGYRINDRLWTSIKVIFNTYDGPYTFSRFGQFHSGAGPLSLYRLIEEKDKVKKRINSEEAEKMNSNIQISIDPGSHKQLYIKKLENPAAAIFTKEFKKSFIEKMKNIVGDDDTLYEKIRQKSLRLKDLESIITKYNSWFTSQIRK